MRKMGGRLVAQDDGYYRATSRVSEDEVLSTASEILKQRLLKTVRLDSPDETLRFLETRYSHYEHEIFGVIWLTNRHQIIETEEMFRGTIDGANVYPREVAKRGLALNAAAIVIFHNHPSGCSEPSSADRSLTRRLCDALALVDIRLIDHIVIGRGETTSFRKRAWL